MLLSEYIESLKAIQKTIRIDPEVKKYTPGGSLILAGEARVSNELILTSRQSKSREYGEWYGGEELKGKKIIVL